MRAEVASAGWQSFAPECGWDFLMREDPTIAEIEPDLDADECDACGDDE